jgi:lysozyme
LLFLAARADGDFIQGVDVYNGDGDVTWSTVKNAGYHFAFVKATEGVNFTDGRFNANMTNANAAGVYVGPYHICRVDSKNGVPFTTYDGLPFPVGSDMWLDATSEAADFIQAIRPYYTAGYFLPPVADIESAHIPDFGSTSLERTYISNWVQLFSDTINNALGVRPLVYASKSSANTYYNSAVASTHKLWEAWWKHSTTSPPLPSDTPAWISSWTFWQWTNLASVPGVPGSEGPNNDLEDGDVFYGTMAQLTALRVHVVPGDYNHNGTVDAADYVVYRNSIGSTVNLAADGNNNQIVDTADLTYWKARLGQSASGAGGDADLGSAPVPEPTTVVLAAAALAMSFTVRML